MNLLRQRHADEGSERPGPRQAVFQAPSLQRASWSGGDSPPALPEQTLELSPERTPGTGPLTEACSPAEFYSRILRTTCGPRNNLPIHPSSSRILPPKRRSFGALYPLGHAGPVPIRPRTARWLCRSSAPLSCVGPGTWLFSPPFLHCLPVSSPRFYLPQYQQIE